MKRAKTSRVGLLVRAMLAGTALGLWCSPVLAQATGGASGSTSTSTATSGGSGLFGTTGTGSSGVTSTTSGAASPINKNNSLNAYYANPYAAGYGPNVTLKPSNSVNVAGSDAMAGTKVTGKGLFGVAMIASTTTSAAGGKGTTTGMGGNAANSSTAANGFATSMGYKRAPAYVTTVSPGMQTKLQQPMLVQGQLQNTLSQSTSLPAGRGLTVTVTDGNVVVINGTVETLEQRQLAESLVRMTPNVQFVRNEIQVAK